MAGTPSSRGRLAAWSSAAVLLVALLLLGLVTGVFVATRVLATTGMGWDQIADALGGAMVGGASALVAWGVALRTLGPPRRFVLAAIAVAGAFGVAAASRTVPMNVRVGNPADVPPPVVESFSLQIGTADGVPGPSADGSRLPWRVLRIGSNLSFDYVPVDRPGELCLAVVGLDSPEDVASFRALRSTLMTVPGEVDCGPPCPSCGDVGLEWYLDQTRFTLQVTDSCWRASDVIRPLRVAVEDIVATYGAGAVCERAGP
jgi:hypothetical protein